MIKLIFFVILSFVLYHLTKWHNNAIRKEKLRQMEDEMPWTARG